MHHMLLVSVGVVVASVAGCSAGQAGGAGDAAPRVAPAAEVAQPMTGFARFPGGRWKMTTTAGKDTYDTWQWGPGNLSIRAMREGELTTGEPWVTIMVYYWHPAFKQIRRLSIGSVMRGVGEGTLSFEEDGAWTYFNLAQTAGPRVLRERWTFAGPDAYRDELSEKVGDDYEVLSAWDRKRVAEATQSPDAQPISLAQPPAPSELLQPLARLLGTTWESTSPVATEASIVATFAYVPHADAIIGRVETRDAAGVSSHVLDMYLYHDTGAQTLRCLALHAQDTEHATVYAGDITLAADGTVLTLALTAHNATGSSPREVRISFAADDTLRMQAWHPQANEPALLMDRSFARAKP